MEGQVTKEEFKKWAIERCWLSLGQDLLGGDMYITPLGTWALVSESDGRCTIHVQADYDVAV